MNDGHGARWRRLGRRGSGPGSGELRPAAARDPEPVERVDFHANVDGDWSRSPEQLSEEVRLLRERWVLAAVPGPRRAGSERKPAPELFVAGAWDAMQWTFAARSTAPLRTDLIVVSDEAVGQVATLARRLARTDSTVADYAAGVAGWLRWLCGEGTHIGYPE